MANWYVSSAAYTAITAFATSHAYSIGNIVKPTSPAALAKYVFRCTTAGTSSTEPAWGSVNNGTTTSGTATFTHVTGQSTYGWSAAAGDMGSIFGSARLSIGDNIYISSDHSESTTMVNWGNNFTTSYGNLYYLSVNRAGSVPPTASDLTAGASFTGQSGFNLYMASNIYWYGCSFVSSTSIQMGGSATRKNSYFKNCSLYLNNVGSGNIIGCNSGTSGTFILDNTTVQFGNTGQTIDSINGTAAPEFNWYGTASAIVGATLPTVLFTNTWGLAVTCRGVDLSAITGTLVKAAVNVGSKYLFDSCKIASGVTRYGSSSSGTATRDVVELVNCYDGTNIISESYQTGGAVTTEFTITLNGGAADNVGNYAHKMVSGSNIDKFVNTLNGFWMDVNNTAIGNSRVATVEIISSASLNNDEISLVLEYEGTAGSSVASFGSSFIATPLTAAAAVTSSSATWNSSPATPVKQKLQVTFTPQVAGRVRGQVRLGKASTTCYYNPQITIT